MVTIGLAHFVDRYNIGMPPSRRCFRFMLKTPDKIRVRKRPVEEHFNGDDPFKTELSGTINHTHTASGNFPK